MLRACATRREPLGTCLMTLAGLARERDGGGARLCPWL